MQLNRDLPDPVYQYEPGGALGCDGVIVAPSGTKIAVEIKASAKAVAGMTLMRPTRRGWGYPTAPGRPANQCHFAPALGAGCRDPASRVRRSLSGVPSGQRTANGRSKGLTAASGDQALTCTYFVCSGGGI
jgi:hypothetical protein